MAAKIPSIVTVMSSSIRVKAHWLPFGWRRFLARSLSIFLSMAVLFEAGDSAMLTGASPLVFWLGMIGSSLRMVGRAAAFYRVGKDLTHSTLPVDNQLPVLTIGSTDRETTVAGGAGTVGLEANALTTEA